MPTAAAADTPVISETVDPDDSLEDEGPVFAWLPPDDRLWRHPSELLTDPLPFRGPVSGWRELEHRVWVLALIAGVVGAVLATGVGVAVGRFDRTTTVVRPVERVVDTGHAQVTPAYNPKDTDVVDIATRLRPAIVELQVDGDKGKGSGSGVIFRSDGYVLTNNHVVEGARTIVAVLADGRQVKGRLIGADPETDVAIVKIGGSSRPVATLGSATGLKVGQLAVAIGSPLGLAGGPSVTVGVVSALGRQVDATNGPPLLDMIQTDAPIAPGSSGGALADQDGNVIGITTAVAVSDSGPQGLGFATPIDIARDVAEQLISTGHVTHVWLGVEGEDANRDIANNLGIDGGAVVKKVVSGSPAAKAGIVISDVITEIDGIRVTSMGALVVAVRQRRPGDRVTIGFMHNGQYRAVQAVVADRPPNPG
jgi:S1-C subfamily serine protease